MSDQLRAILFVVIALAVLFLWGHFNKPPIPPPNQKRAEQAAVAPQASVLQAPVPATPERIAPINIPVVQEAQEKAAVVKSPLYRVQLSNRGGVVRSWTLKAYLNDQTPPRPLELVNPESAAQLGWPFSLLLTDPQLEAKANSALYQVTFGSANSTGGPLHAPAEITYHWSDGHLDVTKKLVFTQSYETSLDVSVTLDGKPLPAAIAWRGGFGDKAVAKASQLVSVFYKENGKTTVLAYKKLGVSGNQSQPYLQSGPLEFTGIEDQFFAAAFVPDSGGLSLWHWTQQHTITVDNKEEKEPEAEMAAGAAASAPLRMHVFVGPKDLTLLSKLKPPLDDLVSFGWTSIVAKPLFYAMKWTHKYVPNYGWAIVLLTIAINIPMFPFKMMSWRSMQKMQKVAPEMQAIKDRYKKYSFNDPRKRKMNEEVMEMYKRHGINPLPIGSCLPMLVQLPIWWGLERVLTGAIELRHAPWIWWIHDLSLKDPYYVLPAAMAIAMYAMTKMTPQTAVVDPAQQKMTQWMPIFFAAFFFNLSAGLNLYIFTSSLVGVGQQYYLNKADPLPTRSKFKNKKKKNNAPAN